MAPKTSAAPGIDLARARAFWLDRQCLATPGKPPLAPILERAGWGRTLGGIDVYLSLRARCPSMRRADLDDEVRDHAVQVVPAVRGCIYLLPRRDVPLALRIAEAFWRKDNDRTMEKVGLGWSEVEALAKEVAKVLASGPTTTDRIRGALPKGAVRSLGEAGKKAGISSPLPIALRLLEFDGRVERTLDGGRLDTERYLWRLAANNPFDEAQVPEDRSERLALLARRFLEVTGTATLDDLSDWSATPKRDLKAAIALLPVRTVTIEEVGESLVLEEDLPALLEATPSPGSIAMLAFEDNYLVLHEGTRLITDPRHHALRMSTWGSIRSGTFGEAKHVSERTVVLDGLISGVWEWDAAKGEVFWKTFDPLPAARRREVQAYADGLGAFIAEDFGHARSFSLDTDELVQVRANALRSGGGPV